MLVRRLGLFAAGIALVSSELLAAVPADSSAAADAKGDPREVDVRLSVPQPVYEAEPGLVDLYYKAWELAQKRIQDAPGMPSEHYMDENLIKADIWIWDTCFMSLFCKYAPAAYPGVETFDNFYAILLNDGSFKIPLVPCDNPWTETKLGDPTPLSVHIADNPPLFAWAELRHARMTGDRARLRRVLKEKRFLQRYYDLVEGFKPGWRTYGIRNPVRMSRTADGYRWAGGQSGMDNTPRGRTTASFAKPRPDNPDLLWLDLLAQQALAARSIAEGLEILGEDGEAKEWRAKYAEKSALLNRLYWDEEDGFYYDVFDSTKERCKVTTVASFWAMAAGIASPAQAARMCARLLPGGALESAAGVTSLARTDADYSPRGKYWRGSVWLPTDYMTIKALEDYGRLDLARDLALKTVRNQYAVYTNAVPHTIWECYAPDRAEPATNVDDKTRVAKDFCGWSALGPISLFIENVIGIHGVDAFAREVRWRLPPASEGRVGLRRFRFGDVTCDLVSEGTRLSVRSTGDFTLVADGRRFAVKAGDNAFTVDSREPVRPRLGGWWRTFTTRSEGAEAGVVDLVMVGDSITQGWVDRTGRDVLKARFGDLKVLSLGVSGNSVEDQLGTCLWGGLDGYRAKVVQVMIGTNNAGRDRPVRTADGIRQLLAVIRAKQPQARIVLIPIFPRGTAGDRCRAENEQVNAIIRGFADGKTVVWKDFSGLWLDAAGNCTTNLMKDLLHPNARGYELWAREVRPLVDELRAKAGDLAFAGIPCVADKPIAPKASVKATDGAEVLFVGDDVRDIHRDVMHRDPWTPEYYRDYGADLWNFDEPTEALLGRLGTGRHPYGVYVICAGRTNVRLRDGEHEPPIDTYVGIKAMVSRIVGANPKARVLVLPPRVLPSDSAEQAARLEAVGYLLGFLPREVERVVTLPRDARAVKSAIGCLIADGARSRPRESVFGCVAHPDDMVACARDWDEPAKLW